MPFSSAISSISEGLYAEQFRNDTKLAYRYYNSELRFMHQIVCNITWSWKNNGFSFEFLYEKQNFSW